MIKAGRNKREMRKRKILLLARVTKMSISRLGPISFVAPEKCGKNRKCKVSSLSIWKTVGRGASILDLTVTYPPPPPPPPSLTSEDAYGE